MPVLTNRHLRIVTYIAQSMTLLCDTFPGETHTYSPQTRNPWQTKVGLLTGIWVGMRWHISVLSVCRRGKLENQEFNVILAHSELKANNLNCLKTKWTLAHSTLHLLAEPNSKLKRDGRRQLENGCGYRQDTAAGLRNLGEHSKRCVN